MAEERGRPGSGVPKVIEISRNMKNVSCVAEVSFPLARTTSFPGQRKSPGNEVGARGVRQAWLREGESKLPEREGERSGGGNAASLPRYFDEIPSVDGRKYWGIFLPFYSPPLP